MLVFSKNNVQKNQSHPSTSITKIQISNIERPTKNLDERHKERGNCYILKRQKRRCLLEQKAREKIPFWMQQMKLFQIRH